MGTTIQGLSSTDVKPGDDEGAVEVSLRKDPAGPILVLNLLVSDTSEYPRHHNFFAYALDAPADLDGVEDTVSAIADLTPSTIACVVERTCLMLVAGSGAVLANADSGGEEDDDEEEGDDDDYEAYDAFDEIKPTGKSSGLGAKVMERLQRSVQFLLCPRPISNISVVTFSLLWVKNTSLA